MSTSFAKALRRSKYDTVNSSDGKVAARYDIESNKPYTAWVEDVTEQKEPYTALIAGQGVITAATYPELDRKLQAIGYTVREGWLAV